MKELGDESLGIAKACESFVLKRIMACTGNFESDWFDWDVSRMEIEEGTEGSIAHPWRKPQRIEPGQIGLYERFEKMDKSQSVRGILDSETGCYCISTPEILDMELRPHKFDNLTSPIMPSPIKSILQRIRRAASFDRAPKCSCLKQSPDLELA